MKRSALDAWIAGLIRGEAGRSEASLEVDHQELARYQLRRLRETIRNARSRSAFYRRQLAGFDEPESLDELEWLPTTAASDIRANPLSFVCVSQDEISRVVTLETSGTTGNPKRIYFTRSDQDLTIDFFRAGMSVFTSPGDRVLILLPVERPGSVGDLLAVAIESMGAKPIRLGPVRDAEVALKTAAEEKATVAVGIPVQLLRMARLTSPGRSLPDLHSVLLSTDHVPDSIVRTIETAWPCRVFNHYGSTEMGLGGGVDCEARRGYHMREADMLFEVIDPRGGHPLPEGQLGEIVFTTLTRTGMPLIRYRTGDLGRWLPGPCPCGSGLRTLSHVKARVGQVVSLGPARLTIADLDEALFAVDGVVDFRACLAASQAYGSHARLTIHVEVAPWRSVEEAARDLRLAVQEIPAVVVAQAAAQMREIELVVGREPVTTLPTVKRSIVLDPAGAEGCSVGEVSPCAN